MELPKKMNVGVIGLGAMGLPMAKNLLRKGFEVTVFDARNEPIQTLEKLGARIGHSPKEVGLQSRIV